MGGKKRVNQYGRYNVQNENARGQVKYETPMQQMLFLNKRIVIQETIKALFIEQQRQQVQEAANSSNQSNSLFMIPARNPFARNQIADYNNVAPAAVLPNQQIQGSSLIEDSNQINQRQQQSEEQQFSQQYSQIIESTQQRIQNLDLGVSFTSNFKDLTNFPVKAQGREIFQRSQSSFHIRKTELQLQAQFMEDKFMPKDYSQMVTLRPGPTLEETLSETFRQQAQEQYLQQRNQFYQQAQLPLPGIQGQQAAQQQVQANDLQIQLEQSEILSIRSSQLSQNSSNEPRVLFPDLFEPALLPQSQDSIQEIQQLEELQNSVPQPIKRNEKKEKKLQSVHQKFQSKYKQYSQAVRLNPEIATFNKKELQKHFSQPWIKYQSKLAAIQMRYGSCDADQIDFLQTQATIQEISKKLGLKYQSVVTIMRNFRIQGRLRTKKKASHTGTKMTKFNFAYILEPETLRQWAPYSLEKRCELIFQKSQVKISRVTLANYYKKHNIKYRKPSYTIHCSKNEEELLRDRKQFITTIVDYYHRNLEIIYIDECSTHLWEKKNRIWVPRVSNINIKLPSSRKESVTVIGAISSHNDKLYYCFCNSTNQNDVLFFFEGLNSSRSDLQLKGKVVVLDNHSSHITKEIREYIQRQGATILFLPVASSYFNPIETMWAWIKAKWRSKLVEPKEFNPEKDYLLRELQNICDTVPPHVVRHISAHCFKTLKSYIEDKLLV